MIQLLCSSTVPSGVLPHTVFVEEVDIEGNPTYNKYSLVSINRAKQTYVLRNKKCDCNLLNNRFLKKKSITIGNDIEMSELL